MRLEIWRGLAASAVCCLLVSGLIAYANAGARADGRRESESARDATDGRDGNSPPPPARLATPSDINGLALVKRARVEGEKVWSTLDTGQRAELTISPSLQQHVRQVFARYEVPAGAFVAIEPHSGRILAYVSHHAREPGADVVTSNAPPAASIFKLVTSAALLDAGVSAEALTCYGGGASSLGAIDLVDDPRRDTSCVSLAKALGASTNAVFAKRAKRHLDPAELGKYARAFGFGQKIPSEIRATAGAADIPEQSLEFARTAAGFWHTHLSPLHGALIASMVANGGLMANVRLIDRVLGTDGRVLLERPAGSQSGRRVLGAKTARTLGEMMQRTVRDGTSHDAFFDPRGRPHLQGMTVAGKTGSLSDNNPYRAYSWWVGYAPADRPQIALAVLVVNSAKWRIKSSFVARDALEHWFTKGRGAQSRALVAERPAARRTK